MSEVTNYIEAVFSLADNLRRSPIEHGFKKACITSLDYISRVSRGKSLGNEKQQLVGNILTLGTTINNFYDMGLLNAKEYIQLRKTFKELAPEREEDFRRYRRELSILEKNRPRPSELHELGRSRVEPIKRYREDVNRLSLAFSFAIAFDKPLSNYFENYDKQPEEEKHIFEGFFNAVMAMQVVDDIVGRNGDLTKDRPSFYTAVCGSEEIKQQLPDKTNDETYKKLNNLFFEYYESANKESSEKLRPILDAVKFTKFIYPTLTDLARKHRFLETVAGVKLLTWRDKKNL